MVSVTKLFDQNLPRRNSGRGRISGSSDIDAASVRTVDADATDDIDNVEVDSDCTEAILEVKTADTRVLVVAH